MHTAKRGRYEPHLLLKVSSVGEKSERLERSDTRCVPFLHTLGVVTMCIIEHGRQALATVVDGIVVRGKDKRRGKKH